MSYYDDESSSDDDEVPILLDLGSAASVSLTPVETNHTEGNEESSSLPEVPVTILTGFLGSGKTTLIQYILRSNDHGMKIAIIENEFSGASAAVGDQPVDAEREGLSIETMIARDGTDDTNLTDLIELPNGCICCTVKDSLVETLEALVNKKKDLDYIIIECSGMANPGPIASIFWLDDALESRLRLDGVVACVDARNLNMQLSETTSIAKRELLIDDSKSAQHIGPGGDEAAQQIAFADRIIINKIDLLEDSKDNKDSKIDQVVQQIRAINATAPLLKTTFSQVFDLNWVLDANCFDIERAREVEAAFDVMEKYTDDNGKESSNMIKCIDSNCLSCSNPSNHLSQYLYCSPCTSAPLKYNHSHTSAISTVALINNGSVHLKKIHTWLASILWPDQDKEDHVLKAQLEELERLNQITTPELKNERRKDNLMNLMHVFRIKGILSIKHDDVIDESKFVCENNSDKRKFIVQAVNDLWEIHPANNSEYWKPSDERICKLVIIGRNLNSEQLLSGFRSCFS